VAVGTSTVASAVLGTSFGKLFSCTSCNINMLVIELVSHFVGCHKDLKGMWDMQCSTIHGAWPSTLVLLDEARAVASS
jgi:hypothetical protein